MKFIIFLMLWTVAHAQGNVSAIVILNGKRNESTNAPVAVTGANVTIWNNSFSKSRSTDGAGYADFGSVPAGIYTVSLYLPNSFYSERRGVSFTSDGAYQYTLNFRDGVPANPPPNVPPPAPLPPPVLTQVTPNPVIGGRPFVVRFFGKDFRRGAVLQYSTDGKTIGGEVGLHYISESELRVYGGADAPFGKYWIRIKNFDGKVSTHTEVTLKPDDIIDFAKMLPILNYLLGGK